MGTGLRRLRVQDVSRSTIWIIRNARIADIVIDCEKAKFGFFPIFWIKTLLHLYDFVDSCEKIHYFFKITIDFSDGM